jgi:hypothetical protein
MACRTEELAQPGDVHFYGVGCGRRLVPVPKIVDQLIGRDDRADV